MIFSEPFNLNDQEENESSDEILDLDADEIESNVQMLENPIEDDCLPFNVWCACHRLQLVAKDSINSFEPAKSLQKVRLFYYNCFKIYLLI